MEKISYKIEAFEGPLDLLLHLISKHKLDIYDLPIVKYLDVLVDGEFEADKKDVKLRWKGSSNQRVIDVQDTISSKDPLTPVIHCPDYYE